MVRYLCELPVGRGVDPSVNDNAAVRSAARGGRLDVVRYLCELPVDRGVDPSAVLNDELPLDVARYLCKAYCSAQQWDSQQQQALRSPLLAVRALVRQRRATPILRIEAAPSGPSVCHSEAEPLQTAPILLDDETRGL